MVSGEHLPMALWQFGKMISCAQPGVNPLVYNEYGCWCGLGGSGTPVDDVDRWESVCWFSCLQKRMNRSMPSHFLRIFRCCEAHDKCYKNSRKIPGCEGVFDLPHIIIYGFSCSNRQVYCSGKSNRE